MRFSESEIEWAARLRGAGLQWDPQPGQYVFDIDGVVKAGSPFQAGVHLVTSPNALATSVGGDDALRTGFAWIPTFEECRAWLTANGVSDDKILKALRAGLKEDQSYRESLYGMMHELLLAAREEAS